MAQEGGIIDDLEGLEESGELSQWSGSFARSVCRQYRVNGYLTDKQWGKIEQILEEA